MIRFVAAGFAALALVCASLAPASASTYYSNRDIRSIFPGTFIAKVDGGFALLIRAGRGGRLTARLHNFRDHGRWSISRGRLCLSLDKLTKGRKLCARVIKAKSWYILAAFGQPTITFRRVRVRRVRRRR